MSMIAAEAEGAAAAAAEAEEADAGAAAEAGASGADMGGTPGADRQPHGAGNAGEGEGDDAGGEGANPNLGAPEAYEFEAVGGVEVDSAVAEAFAGVARELDLSQVAAQKVLNKVVPTLQARQVDQIRAVQEQWTADARADKEFGGDALKANLALGAKAVDRFGTPELKDLLEKTGLGNHPEVIRAFVRVGKAISDDTLLGAKGAPKGGIPSTFEGKAEALYGKK